MSYTFKKITDGFSTIGDAGVTHRHSAVYALYSTTHGRAYVGTIQNESDGTYASPTSWVGTMESGQRVYPPIRHNTRKATAERMMQRYDRVREERARAWAVKREEAERAHAAKQREPWTPPPTGFYA